MKRGVWSEEEHTRFLQAIRYYPEGPWSKIAGCIGTRSARQVQTHAQRYYEKVQRHVRGLQRDRSKSTHKEHRIDEDILRLQHLHRVAKSSAKAASVPGSTSLTASTDPTQTEQEPHRRLYRSKDPPPCLQRLAGLPTQPSPVGVHDTPLVSPRFGAPAGYHYDHHQNQYSHPVSPMYDHSKVITHGLQYARYEPVYHQYPGPPPMPSPHAGQPHRGGYQAMPSLPPIMTKLCEPHHEHQSYSPYGSSFGSSYMLPVGASPTGRASPHDSQVITSSIRGSEDPTTPRLPSVRPTLSLPQPGLLLPRIFS